MTAVDTGYVPNEGERWEFDGEVTRVFDDMLGRSIPQYETMRGMVCDVGSAFVRGGTAVVDIGCSRGEALASMYELPGMGGVTWRGYEISAPMLEAARARFTSGPDGARVPIPNVRIEEWDLRRGYPPAGPVSLTLAVLTLMFVPINYRQRVLHEAAQQTVPGGALILVEKVLGAGPRTDDLFNANYHRKKADSGYTPEEIERKRLSLEGQLVPLPADFNETMLRRAGFTEVDCFWAWHNFRGWVAIR